MEKWKLDDGVVQFPSGRRIRGRSWKTPVVDEADLSLVLTTVSGKEFASYSVFPGSTESVTIDWPDERLPRRASHAISQLSDVWKRAENERVEITCRTGIGRTGTALAIIAVFEGMSPDEAIEFVRANYNDHSVSSPAQRGFLREYAFSRNDGPEDDTRETEIVFEPGADGGLSDDADGGLSDATDGGSSDSVKSRLD